MNQITIDFLEYYKKLEQIAVDEYGCKNHDSVSELERHPQLRTERAAIKYCKDVRNLLAHNPKLKDEYVVDVNTTMLDLVKSLIMRIKNPKRAKQIAIPYSAIFTAGMDDKLMPILKKMRESKYTYVPIVNDKRVVGVFSENSIFEKLVDDEIIGVESDYLVRYFEEYIPLDKHGTESFWFVKEDCFECDITEVFNKEIDQDKRIELIFVTKNGRSEERLIGMITPWDLFK